MSLIFPLKYSNEFFALTIFTVMLSQSQGTDATGVDSEHDVWDFPEELPGHSIDPLGSRYLHPIRELSDRDSATTPCCVGPSSPVITPA